MRFTKSVCLIVDAYATGENLAPAFNSRGFPCIHIKSSDGLPAKFQHKEADFAMSLVYQGDIDALIAKLKSLCRNIKLCVPGYESGVELADLLAEKLNLPGNGSALSKARRDKFAMTETVAKAGLKTVRHFKSNSLEDIQAWAKQQNAWPIVLKPLESANGDGVFFCEDETAIKIAFQKIMLSNNQFNQVNIQVLAQTFNAGQEYIVNTASWEGQHYVAEIWRITRIPFTTIYDKAEIVHPNEAEWQSLSDYTQQVLNALGIRYGAGTTELKYTKEQGPVLLETSSRLMSGAPVAFSDEMLGFSQLSLLVEAYLNPKDFLRRFQEKRPAIKQYGMGVILISNHSGTLQRNLNLEPILNLTTLHTFEIKSEAGKTIHKTENSLTTPGEIYLMANSQEALEADYQKIRSLEKTLYQDAMLLSVTSITHFFTKEMTLDNTSMVSSVSSSSSNTRSLMSSQGPRYQQETLNP